MKLQINRLLRIALIVIICCSLILPTIQQLRVGQANEPPKELEVPFSNNDDTTRNAVLNNGYGLVAPRSYIGPSMSGAKGTGDWEDAKLDTVNIGNLDYFTVLTKINGSYLYVGVVLNPDYDKKAEASDSCAVVFDKNHAGGKDPGVDDWYVECKIQSTGFSKLAKKGDGTKWMNMPWPIDWEVDARDLLDTLQLYIFKINVSVIFRPVEGNLIGFGVKLYDKGGGDTIYWPDKLNPGGSPEDWPDSWGHLIYYRPMLLINKVSSNNTEDNEWIELYNNCSTELIIHDVLITNQDGNSSVLPNVTIPAYKYVIVISGIKGDESDFSGNSEIFYIGGRDWWCDLGDDILLKFKGNDCVLDYMQYGTGSEIDSHPIDTTSNSDWYQNTPPIPAPTVIQYLNRIGKGQDTNRSSDWEISNVKTRPLDHIALTPMFSFPSANRVRAKGTIDGYRAVGWNDEEEAEKNYTWTPVWSTTNKLGALKNSRGDAVAGYTIEYAARLVPGYDNVTVMNKTAEISNQSCIQIYGNPLHHITLTPVFEYPSAKTVIVGETVSSYIALGWNDVTESEKNLTWKPEWNAVDGLGALGNFGGSAGSGFFVYYTAGTVPGYDNITVKDDRVNISNKSCIKIVAGPPYQISMSSGNNQIGTAGTALSEPFVIEIQDQYGNPIDECAEVWFNITTIGLNGDGTLSQSNLVMTNENGCANATLTLDTKPGKNTVTVELNDTGNSQIIFSATGTLPQVSPYLVANVSSVVAEQTFDYFLHYYIIGNEPATNVWINDSLSASLEYISDTSGAAPIVAGANYSWHFSSLEPGAYSFILTCRVSSEVENGTLISNYFTIDYSDETGMIRLTETSNMVHITMYSEPVQNIGPSIEGVPDLVVHYDWDYKLDLSPYITDLDSDSSDLNLIFSDTINIRLNLINNLMMILNYSYSYVGTTQMLTITVSDGLSSDWDVINVEVTDNFPPEAITNLPDVIMDEDTIAYPFNITHYFIDRDGEPIYSAIGENNINITFLQNHTIRVTPLPNWFGTERVTFRAIDDKDALIEETIDIVVVPVNDPPLISEIANQTGNINNAWILDLSQYLQDIDNINSDLIVSTDSSYVTVNGLNLTFRYNQAVNFDIVTITVSDGEGVAYRQVYVSVKGPSETSSLFDQIFLWLIIFIIIIIIIMAFFILYKRRKPLVEDVFLIYQDGSLLAHATRRLVPDLDTDLFSGMLTAIQDFVKDSFKDEKDCGLKKLEFGDNKLCIEPGESGKVFLVFVYKGEGDDRRLSKVAKEVLVEVEEQFGKALKKWDGKMSHVRGTKDIISHAFQK